MYPDGRFTTHSPTGPAASVNIPRTTNSFMAIGTIRPAGWALSNPTTRAIGPVQLSHRRVPARV
jgi:hypothetical protein